MAHDTDADRLKELHDRLERSVAELVGGEDWAAMLETAARFHTYSFGNVMLIMSQCPDATRVAGYRTWQSLGRQVRRGERGIRILAPSPWRREPLPTDPPSAVDADGMVHGLSFRVVSVFDQAQTDGEEIPDVRPILLAGAAPEGLWAALVAQVEAAGYRLERGDCRGANGYSDPVTKTVRVRDDVDDAQVCKTLVHELAHVLLHCNDGAVLCRGRAEVEAESVAHLMCAVAGLTSDLYSFPYVARWAGGDLAVVRDTATTVIETAQSILAGLEGSQTLERVA